MQTRLTMKRIMSIRKAVRTKDMSTELVFFMKEGSEYFLGKIKFSNVCKHLNMYLNNV